MAKKKTKQSWLSLFDRYGLLVITAFLAAFLPLYPKVPLFDVIEGYIVRIRLDDIMIAVAVLLYFIQVLRKKVTLTTPLSKLIFGYIAISFLSVLSGIFLTQTIPATQAHVLKSTFHFFRYIQYFTLFFITTAAIKSKKDLRIILSTLVLTVLAVGVYGLGQKYLYWPVYSTMNREFSKGITLYLTEFARVQSTFAGHYDMAAYLVLLMPIILMLIQTVKTLGKRLLLWTAYTLGMWLMVLSASRTSLAGLLFGLYFAIGIVSLYKQGWGNKIWHFIKESFKTGILFLVIFISFGDNMAERLLQSLESYPQFYEPVIMVSEQGTNLIAQIKLPEFMPIPEITTPENGISTDQAAVLVASDTRPTPIKPSDVKVDVPDLVEVATVSAEGVESTVVIEVPRTYSDNALKYGLSLAIRLDTLWPQALDGFYSNPALGSGYGTLTKSEVNEFTEADSTDNNFLRTLGETGGLGFIAFYGVVVIALSQAIQLIRNKNTDTFTRNFAIGYIGATLGLLLNATFIDVFAASKVAYTFWMLTGIVIAVTAFPKAKKTKKLRKALTTVKKKQKRKRTFSNTK